MADSAKLVMTKRRAFILPERVSLDAATIDAEQAAVILADALEWPMVVVKPRGQVGRLVLVEYRAVGGFDPDAIIAVGDRAFNKAMAAFLAARRLDARRFGEPRPTRGWYANAREKAKAVLFALWRIQPTEREIAFVVRWLLLAITRGPVYDGIGEV